MTVMRAKMKVMSVTKYEQNEQVTFQAVTDGTPEDNNYSKWTPSANLTMMITNENLFGKLVAGQKYYVDFTLADPLK